MGEQVMLEGNVVVAQGARRATAQSAKIDRAKQQLTAQGDIEIRQPGLVLLGDQASYAFDTGASKLSNAYFTLHEPGLTGSAQHLQHDGESRLKITEGALTFCPPDNPFWVLRSHAITVDQAQGMGEARDATLDVMGLPIAYIPWVQFPIDERRKTGLLFPDIGTDSRGGLDITLPIYWNLAPNYDLTYSPRLIEERGLNHQLDGRYLGDTLGYWEVGAGYLDADDKWAEDTAAPRRSRWSTAVRQEGFYGQGWYSRIDYSRVSDTDYLRDLNNQNLNTQRQTALLQSGEVGYLTEQWSLRVRGQQFQSLAQDLSAGYQKIPEVTLEWFAPALRAGLKPDATIQYTHFEASDSEVTGQRLFADVGVSYPIKQPYGYLTPRLGYRHLSYDIDDNGGSLAKPDSADAAMFSLKGGLWFERSINLAGAEYTHTVEPTFFYLYSDYSQQTNNPLIDTAQLTFGYDQLWRDTRFSGHDRLDDANQLSVGFTTRLVDKEKGTEKFRASVGQVFYFQDRRVSVNPTAVAYTEKTSALAGELAWIYSPSVSLRSQFLADIDTATLDAGALYLRYQPSEQSVVNLGYTRRVDDGVGRQLSYVRDERLFTEQVRLSAYQRVSTSWRMFTSLAYSLELSEPVETMVGFEFEDCCWQVRAMYMRYVNTQGSADPVVGSFSSDYENAVQIQFSLKGLGAIGARLQSLIAAMIPGAPMSAF